MAVDLGVRKYVERQARVGIKLPILSEKLDDQKFADQKGDLI